MGDTQGNINNKFFLNLQDQPLDQLFMIDYNKVTIDYDYIP